MLKCPICGSADVEPSVVYGDSSATSRHECNSCGYSWETMDDAGSTNDFRIDGQEIEGIEL